MPDSPLYRHLLIRASAGTGKTFQLSNRFLQLLRDGVPHERVLATTFTRKAAGEILDRVILRLAQATQDADKLQELAQGTGGGRVTREACLRWLEQAMRHLHRLRVSTLDSFFAQIARCFSLELGLPPGWQIVEDWDDARLRGEAIAAILSQADPAELRTLMNLLTKGEANRSVSELIRSTVQELYALFLETTSAAWHALPRFPSLGEQELADSLEDLRTVAVSGKRLVTARDQDYERACQGDWPGFLAKGLTAKVLDGTLTFYSQPIPPEVAAVYQRLIDHVRGELVGRVVLQTEASYELLHKFDAAYQRLKQSRRALRFEDLTRQLSGLAELAAPDRLTFRLDSRIDHLLLDEFQDTSPPQWRVVKPLARRLTADVPGGSLFCVGDVKQAIYGWRGGEAAIFDAIDRQLGNLVSEQLVTSYRSAPVVIEAVNRLFAQLPQHSNLGRSRAAVEAWCRAFEPHRTQCTDLPGYVEVQCAPRAPEGQPQAEATLIFAADRIAEILRHAAGREVRMGVLVRTNKTVGRLIYELRQRGLEASEEGGNPLTDSAAVLTILSALQLADHPGDSVARFHVAHSPLGPVLAPGGDWTAARAVAQQIRRALVADGYGSVIYGWTERLAPHCSPRELSRLEQLVEVAYAYGQEATLRPSDFVSYVAQKRVSATAPAPVRVMTIHQAKGLEFEAVVLPELESGLIGQPDAFVSERADVTGPVERVCRYAHADIQRLLPPAIRQMFEAATDRAVKEALCVLYVAVTRAKQALYAILPPPAANEKSLPCTYAGLLRAAFEDAPAEPEARLYQQGRADWYRARPSATQRRGSGRIPGGVAEPLPVALAPSAGPRCRGWERARPSGLEGGPLVATDQVLCAARSTAFFRGRLIHAWFEQVGWLEEGRPTEPVLQQIAATLLASDAPPDCDVPAELDHFYALLDQPNLAQLFSAARYRALHGLGLPPAVTQGLRPGPVIPVLQAERGFALRDGGRLLTGFIDRLVLLTQAGSVVAAEILDFKTDAVRAGEAQKLAQKVAFYAPQMNAYRRAVASFARLPLEAVLARLVFVEAGVVQTVPAADADG